MSWLATVARNESLRLIKRRERESLAPSDDLDTRGFDDDIVILRTDRDARLWQAIDTLPVRCRTLLYTLETDPRPSYDEVAIALDMPQGSIGPTRGRCLARLRRAVAQVGLADAS